MQAITLYHNPRCSKSREALKYLEDKKMAFQVREYLKDPLSIEEIKELNQKLGIPVRDMIRDGEEEYEQEKLEGAAEEELFRALSKHPVLLQRPVIVSGLKAVIARPVERIRQIL